MRRITTLSIVLFLIVARLQAQPDTRTIVSENIYLTLSGRVINVTDLNTQDSLTPGNTIFSSGECSISVTGDLEFKKFLVEIINISAAVTTVNDQEKQKVNPELLFSFTNQSSDVTRERRYTNPTITSIRISALDATRRDRVVLKIKFQSSEMVLSTGGGNKISAKAASRKAAITNSYMISLVGLPGQRVTSVSSISLNAASEKKIITFELSRTDAAAWLEQLFKNSTQGKTFEGDIALMEPSLRDDVLRLTVLNASIVKTEENSPGTKVLFTIQANVEFRPVF